MEDFSNQIDLLQKEIGKIIVWQHSLKRDIIVALLSGGHILLEWAPGLAKTRTVSSFSQALDLGFQRIQFTPDLLPSDLVWAKIYDPEAKEFEIKKGPIFSNIILADEINRAPSKVQSALLEAMEEKQVTLWDTTFSLDRPFMVLATQNPLEQEWTFHLPEAQLDRFLLKTLVKYPTAWEEKEILVSSLSRELQKIEKIFWKKEIEKFIEQIDQVEVSESVYEYICHIIFASRDTQKYPEITFWGSPRASLALLKTAKVLAAMDGRNFVIPEDVKSMSHAVLRHRIILSYEAQANDITTDDIISQILDDTKIL